MDRADGLILIGINPDIHHQITASGDDARQYLVAVASRHQLVAEAFVGVQHPDAVAVLDAPMNIADQQERLGRIFGFHGYQHLEWSIILRTDAEYVIPKIDGDFLDLGGSTHDKPRNQIE